MSSSKRFAIAFSMIAVFCVGHAYAGEVKLLYDDTCNCLNSGLVPIRDAALMGGSADQSAKAAEVIRPQGPTNGSNTANVSASDLIVTPMRRTHKPLTPQDVGGPQNDIDPVLINEPQTERGGGSLTEL